MIMSLMICNQQHEYGRYLLFLMMSTESLISYKPPFSCVLVSVSVFDAWMSCSTSGRLVTTPVPRGRKSRPTRLSSTELLPELCSKHKQLNQTDRSETSNYMS